jgi:ABC-2 type transport system ATP-binding protein
MGMSSTIIETTGLTRAYSPDAGVWGLDLRVPQGAIYAFLGPNGSGKTTTIRLLLGLLKADAGNILIDGEPVHVGTRPHHWIGSMVEGPSLYPHLTGRENLHIAGRLLGAGRAQVGEALQTVGLVDAGNRLVKQ